MAVTYTPNYNLAKYDAGDIGWDTGINANFDTIDSTLADLQNQIDNIPVYLSKPIIIGNNYVYELQQLINYIDNYDSTAIYTVTFSDSILSATLNSNEIIITAGENISPYDITITMIVTISKSGYISNYVTRDITVKNYTLYADDGLLIYDTTYIVDSFDVIENGLIE